MIRHPWPLPRKATGHEPAPEQHTGPERIVPPASETGREPEPFTVSPLALMQMSAALMSAQDISDALEREGPPAEGEIPKVRA